MAMTVPPRGAGVAGAGSRALVGISAPGAQDCRIETRGMSLYLDVMTSADLTTSSRLAGMVSSLWSRGSWRATMSAMGALLVAAVGTTLLGVIGVVWGAAIFSLVTGAGDVAHVAVYVAAVIVGPVAELSAVQGVSALQRSRLRAVSGVDIPAGSRTAERKPWPFGPWLSATTWRQITFHLLSVGTGAAAAVVAICWLAPALAVTYLVVGAPSVATA